MPAVEPNKLTSMPTDRIKSWAERATFAYAKYIGHILRHPLGWTAILQDEWQAQHARTAYAMRGSAHGPEHVAIKAEEALQRYIEHLMDINDTKYVDWRYMAHDTQWWAQAAPGFAAATSYSLSETFDT